MPIFKPGVSIETKEPTIVIENRLRPGRYRFQLVVVNRRGQTSEPATWELVVSGPIRPGARRRQAAPKRTRAKE